MNRTATEKLLLLVLPLILVVGASASDGGGVSGDPDAAKLVTSDVDAFWRAYDRSTADNRAQVLDREYLKPGSDGLKDFTFARIQNAESLAKVVNSHPKYFESLRESTSRLSAMRGRIRACFYALKYLYNDAVFPNVYFLVGRMNSGGTTSNRGLLIGAEMYGRTATMPESEMSDWLKQVLRPVGDIPYIVAHELIHYQQKYPQKIKPTLLEKSVDEGAADFIGELISGGNINKHLHDYGNPREKQIWLEFSQDMDNSDFSKWLYNGSNSKDRPADLGYYVGYKIAEAYYDHAADKRQAIREILTITDFHEFLTASRYQKKFSG
jgi:hypothetical protein